MRRVDDLIRPTAWVCLAGATLAFLYGWLELDPPPGTGIKLFGLALGVLVVGTLAGYRYLAGNLAALRKVARDTKQAPRAVVQAAARETHRAPDRAFVATAAVWVLGALAASGLFWSVTGVTSGMAGRIAVIGILLAPAVALLAHLAVLRRSREVMGRLIAVAGSAQDVIDAVPPVRRQMRARLVAFTVITVLTPSLLIAQLCVERTSTALDEMARAESGGHEGAVAAAGRTRQLASTLVLAGAVMVLVLAAARASGAALEEPMRAMSEQARRIGEGDLSSVRLIPVEDELWAASTAVAGMHVHLLNALRQLQKAGLKISTTTEQIVQMSSRHQSGATEQAASLNETMATTEELARSARQISSNAGAVARMADEMLAAARTGQRNAQTFAQSMVGMRRDNQGIADSVVRLNKRVQQIGKIVEFINGIADKSDLLALNAELEGTKAGDVGRGFSLVAAEMRRVAENVTQSTRQISVLIEEIRDATNAAVMATEAGVKATDAGSAHSTELSNRLSAILDLANATSDAIRAISLATQQQQAGTDQLAIAMANVLQITQQSAQSTRQLGAANADLVALARDLKVVVDRFRVTS